MSSAGQGSFSMSHKDPLAVPPGPPFVATSAYNGCSVDPITGQIVLGDDPGGILGQFVNNREIQGNGVLFTLLDTHLIVTSTVGGNLIAGFTNSDFVGGYSGGAPATVQINHGGGNFGLAVARATSDSNGPNFVLYKTRGGGVASVVGALVDADILGNIFWQGVSISLAVRIAVQITARAVTVNTGNVWGTGAVPINQVAGIFDVLNNDMNGTSKNCVRIFPNGETVLSNTNAGGVVPRLDGMRFQVYGTAGIQTGLNVGAIANNNVSAVLECTSTTQGFLVPRMTNAQRIAIPAPADGLQVYCTDAVAGLYIWKAVAAAWVFII
jgi:hypothetical protein